MKNFAKYKVLKPMRCPEFKHKKGKTHWYKEFHRGDKVTGYVNNKTVDGVRIAPHIIAQGRWRIPLNNIEKMSNVAGDTVEAGKELNELAKKGGLKQIVSISKNSATGALIGLLAGWVLAAVLKQNKIIFAFAGSVGGGIIGNAVGKIKPEKQKKSEVGG